MTVYESILEVCASIGTIGKNGENTHFKFKYQAWDDVLPAVRAACVQHKLTIMPNVTAVERDGKKVQVWIQFHFFCGDSTAVSTYIGESLDNDDKALQKAITSATKYFYLKTFMIPCSDDTDNDGDGAPKPKTKPKAGDETARADTIKRVATHLAKTLGFTQEEYKKMEADFKTAKKDMFTIADQLISADTEIDKETLTARMRDALVRS